MTDKRWKDWHVIQDEKEEEERRLLRNPHQMEEVGLWPKIFLAVVASPFIFLYAVHRIAYWISLPVLWVAIGVLFDPWKPFARPLATLVGICSAVAVLLGVLLLLSEPSLLFDAL